MPKLNIQFGAYGTFMAFFGLAKLYEDSTDFMGVCDYASSMTFELVTNQTTDVTSDDVSVRFHFSNGTAAENTPRLFPLFNQSETTLSWADFKSNMTAFAVEDDEEWCGQCGNTDGACAESSSNGDSSSDSSSDNDDDGISKPVAGVIGALVTLAVILGLEAAFMLLGGYRLIKKSSLARTSPATGGIKA